MWKILNSGTPFFKWFSKPSVSNTKYFFYLGNKREASPLVLGQPWLWPWAQVCAWDIRLPLAVQDYKLMLAKAIFQASLLQSCILTSIASECLLTLHLSSLEARNAEMLPRAFSAYLWELICSVLGWNSFVPPGHFGEEVCKNTSSWAFTGKILLFLPFYLFVPYKTVDSELLGKSSIHAENTSSYRGHFNSSFWS